MPQLTKEEILKIGKLARLDIDPDELDGLQGHFARVLEYFEVMKELDVSGISLADSEHGESMPLREDRVNRWDGREALLDQAPDRRGDFIRVPRIGGGDDE